MKLHEYQAKDLLDAVGVKVLKGFVAGNAAELDAAIANLSASGPWVVKAQVHAGGRGKAGGVKLAKTKAELKEKAQAILGMTLVSKQTGPQGVLVKKILLVEACDIAKEIYVSILMDRKAGKPLVIASAEGGMEIEELAVSHPEKILKVHLDPLAGMQAFQSRALAYQLAPGEASDSPVVAELAELLMGLSRAFFKYDASLVEVNPLIITPDKQVIALDAKVAIEDNALFRHPKIEAMRDVAEENPKEVKAAAAGLNYIALDGNIGCLVNGAGLAMATMDLIKLHGGAPNNFLDVGGGANKDTMLAAFKLLLGDEQVKGILVNIFGGIVRCDLVAQGVIDAAKEVSLNVPMVVRLEGTNVEAGRKLLAESGLPITPAAGFNEATLKIVEAVRGK
ncbi:MAG TPA: ADP-forming succinate--CoA ligase subunit beta [bacterium]|jgi:succinyl-CoA synthetase beta subunit|nr:ADP-forming succinate--CoA ligase subunit beta [bacterium]